jgi:5'(3')-deoxyribonucleotidase
MKRPITILLDMDGVLCNWHQAAMALFNVQMKDLKMEPPLKYDICHWIGSVLSREVKQEELKERIDNCHNFWLNLNPYPWYHNLYVRLSEVADVVISTSPNIFANGVAQQKMEWLNNYFGGIIKNKHCMIGEKKHLMADSAHMLIDDAESNVTNFRQHGGAAILFPQPWNGLHQLETPEAKLDFVFENLFGFTEARKIELDETTNH